jgi:hypothetical protein
MATARRQEVFRQLVSRIDLRFDKVQRGKRTECPLNSGEIHLRTTEDNIFGSVSRGDCPSFEPLIRAFLDAAAGTGEEMLKLQRISRLSA